MGLAPGASWVAGFEHIDAEVGIAIVNVELPFVVTKGGCPYPVAVLGFGIVFKRVLTRQGMANQRPPLPHPGRSSRHTKSGLHRCRRPGPKPRLLIHFASGPEVPPTGTRPLQLEKSFSSDGIFIVFNISA